MKKIYLLIFSGLFFILSLNTSNATHLMGGDLMYECLGGNQYQIKLKLYRDCQGVSIEFPYTEPITLTAFSDGGCSDRSVNMQRESMRELSPICPSQQDQSACNGGNLIGSEEYVYTGTVTLPEGCGDWTVATSFYYRNEAITNLEDVSTNQYDMYLRTTIEEQNDSLCNASPEFTNPPVPYICNGYPYNYNHQAVDSDGDSLAYKLMNPMDEAVPPGDSIPFATGFSTGYPINTASGDFSIDVNTGMITFTPQGDYAPNNDEFMQVAVLAVLVEEYRNGELIGTVMRDIQVVVVDCDNIPPYRTSVSDARGDPSATRVDSNTFRVCAGDSLAFSSDMNDDDAGDTLSLTDNLNNTIPDASVRSSGINPITGTFSWNTTPVDTGEYAFTLGVEDDACPLVGSNSYLYNVEVTPRIMIDPAVQHVSCSDSGSITAEVTTGPANPQFNWQEYPDSSGNSLTNIPAGTYHLSIEDTSGYYCSFDTSFTIEPAPEAVIDSVDVTGVRCSGPGEAEVLPEDPGYTYEYNWNGNGWSDSAVATLPAGSYNVEIRIQGTSCTDEASFVIPPPPEINLDSLDLRPETCSGPGYAAVFAEDTTRDYEYNWNGNGWSDSSEARLPSGNHDVEIRITGTACVDDTSFRIDEIGDIEIDTVIVSNSGCFDNSGTAEVRVSPPGRPYTYSWSGAGGNYRDNAFVDSLAIGNHNVTVTDTEYGCKDSTGFSIKGKGIDYDLTSSPDQCGSGVGRIVVNPQGSLADSLAEIQWNDIGTDTLIRDNLHAGTYGFTLSNPNASSSNCSVDTTIGLNNVVDPVNAAFSYRPSGSDDDYDVGEPVHFTNESQGDVDSSHWNFGDGATSTKFNPSHTYQDTGMYEITLEVATKEGCMDQARKALQIIPLTPCNKAMPNAFSPNGDGQNDDIGILGNVEDVQLTIFNRWGEVVFRTHNREERWDGTYRGERAPVGVYPYVLYYTCPEDNKRRRHVGQITLVR